MSAESARAFDVLIAVALLAAAGVIVWRALNEAEPLVATAVRLMKRAS